ncbi:hypothetical protein [Lacticaseibacillus hulanensis]|uniref:hypothetical protein n=1 Tax=Lacticaseibacillus hulanensis TaxID=2493111 RepID=UPI000FD6C24B|nr:hypothetical protein [Lacticaseibacillus hulanensis]
MNEENLIDTITDCILKKMIDSKRSLIGTAVKDINELDKHDDNYVYLFLNEEIFPAVIELAGYRILLRNMLDNGIIDPHKLDVGTQLMYSLPRDNRMQSVVFAGLSTEDLPEERWQLKSINTRGGERGVVRTISTADFIARVSTANSISTRRMIDYREKFAEQLGIKQFSRTSDKQIIILAESSVINEVTNSMVDLGGASINFGALFQGRILKSQGEMVDDFKISRHTSRTAYPFITYATNIDALWAYLNESASDVERIYVIGRKWWAPQHQTAIEWLFSYAKAKKISIDVVSTVASMMNRVTLNRISKSSSIYAWFESQNVLRTKLSINPIDESREEFDAWRDIVDFSSEYREDSEAFGIVNWIGVLRTIYFSTIDSGDDSASKLLASIQDAIFYSQLDREVKGNLNEALNHSLDSKFAIRLDNELNKIGYGQDTLILTSPRTATVTAGYLKRRGKRATVLGYNAEINHQLYHSFSKIVLINPTAVQRRRWLFAGLGGLLICLYPESFLPFSLRSMQTDLAFANTISDSDFINDGGIDEIIPSIRKAITETKQEKNKVQDKVEDIDEQSMYGFEDDEFEDGELDQLISKRLPTGRQILSDNQLEQNRIVTVTSLLRFEQNKSAILLGTPNGRVIRRKNDAFELARIDCVHVGDVIAYVKLEDCVESYRKTFLKISDSETELNYNLDINLNQKLDFYWKRQFINYVEKHKLSPSDLQKQFSALGYQRSVGFFQAWSSPHRLNFVPRDIKFIEKIGELTGHSEFSHYSRKYYKASQTVREQFQVERQSQLERLEYEDIDSIDYPVSFLTVSDVESVHSDVNRSQTNRILEKPEEELR